MPSRARVKPGEALLRIREAREFSQLQLAERAGLTQSTISGLESGRYKLGVKRAKTLARALRVHPGSLLFPGWDVEKEGGA
jgi:transcriptional regulator with XRE-family HTH domain